jgi:hypothetical protein
MESQYQPPILYEVPTYTPFNANKALQNRDPRLIRLQQVEHTITSFNAIRVYIAIILLLIVSRVVVELLRVRFTAPISLPVLLISIFQIIGYAYGLHVHTSKSRLQSQIFCCYVVLSFGMIVYFAYQSVPDKDWVLLTQDMINIVLNVLLLYACKQYIKMLKERDQLRKSVRDSLLTQVTQAIEADIP